MKSLVNGLPVAAPTATRRPAPTVTEVEQASGQSRGHDVVVVRVPVGALMTTWWHGRPPRPAGVASPRGGGVSGCGPPTSGATMDKEQRAVVVISSLAPAGRKRLKVLYRALETISVEISDH